MDPTVHGQKSEAAQFIDKSLDAEADAFKKPETPGSKLKKKKLKKKEWSPVQRSPSVKRRFSTSLDQTILQQEHPPDEPCICNDPEDPDKDFQCPRHPGQRQEGNDKSDGEASVSSKNCDDGYIMVGRDGKAKRGSKKQKRGIPITPP